MKKITSCVILILLLAGPVVAQRETSVADTIEKSIQRLVAQRQAEDVKIYYADPSTAKMCESWNSCAKWALKQYSQDKTFKVVKAELKTQREVYRHLVREETHLFVQAEGANRTVYVEFITPQANRGQQSYSYIVRSPRK